MLVFLRYKGFYEMQNGHGSPDVYTISGSMDDDIAEILSDIDPVEYSRHRDSLLSLDMLPNSCFDNPVFEHDDIDIVIENHETSDNYNRCSIPREDELCGGQPIVSNGSVNSRTSRHAIGVCRKHCESEPRNSSPTSWRKDKRYETWPSPKRRKRSVKRSQNNNAKSFSNADTVQVQQTDRIVNEIPTVKCRTCSSASLDGLTGRSNRLNINIKDNRLKSNIRSHAMAATERRRSMAFDQGAVEALSKEDLLVLWKRSEIDLQTRLNRMLHQNSHLRKLVQLAEDYQRINVYKRTKQEKDIRTRKVSNEHLIQADERSSENPPEMNSHLTKVSDEIEYDPEGENRKQCDTKEDKLTNEIAYSLVDETSEQRRNEPITESCNGFTKELENNDRIRKNDAKARRPNNASEELDLSERTDQLSIDDVADGVDQEDNDYHIMTTRL